MDNPARQSTRAAAAMIRTADHERYAEPPETDGLAPARGILLGVLLGAILWAMVLAAAWWLPRLVFWLLT